MGEAWHSISQADIFAAHRRIAGAVTRTPLIRAHALSDRLGGEIWFKLESLQPTGAFKLRGATNALSQLPAAAKAAGVVCVSTGNHGRGLAHAGRVLGIRVVVCMSSLVPAVKVEGIRKLGAEVRIHGASQDEAQGEVDRLIAEEGLVEVGPFDDPAVIAGQGTVGLEILEDMAELDQVVVPLSGGGLISGVALALKTASPAIEVHGVTMAEGAAMYESLRAGHVVEVVEKPTLADCLGGGIGPHNRYTFDIVRHLVDHSWLVDEAAIAGALSWLYHEERLIAEGGAAVGVASLLGGHIAAAGKTTVVVISGRNIDTDKLTAIVAAKPHLTPPTA